MKKFCYNTLTHAINRYLKLDPESNARLKRLQGKTVTLKLHPIQLSFQCRFDENQVKIYDDELFVSDAIISGTPLQLLKIMINKEHRHGFFADDVIIEGDAEVAQLVITLFDALEIDWEELLSHYVGDAPAHHMGNFTRKIRNWFSETNKSFTANVRDYLHEETEWFPTREALQDFFEEIDELRADLERLDAKISVLFNYAKGEESE